MRHCTISIYVWLQFQIVNSKLMQLKIFDFFSALKKYKSQCLLYSVSYTRVTIFSLSNHTQSISIYEYEHLKNNPMLITSLCSI